MRPRTIALAETLFIASLVLALVGSAMAWSVARATFGTGIAVGSLIAFILVPFLLLVWATRARSRIGLWLLTIWTAFSVWSVVRQVTQGSTVNVVAVITLVQVALMLACVVLLFTGPSRRWFAGVSGSRAGMGA